MERRVLKVLKALADYRDLTLGDLLEGIVLHAFDGKRPFNEDSLNASGDLRSFMVSIWTPAQVIASSKRVRAGLKRKR